MTINTRAKGQRSFAKAMAYAKATYPKGALIPLYQVSRWAQPQPFDLLVLDFDAPALLVEVRTNQWGVAKPQTRTLAKLPGRVRKQIWLFDRGQTVPRVRTWDGMTWETS